MHLQYFSLFQIVCLLSWKCISGRNKTCQEIEFIYWFSVINSQFNEVQNDVGVISETLALIKENLEQLKPENKLTKNCAESRLLGDTISGVRTVYPYGYFGPRQVDVYCDQLTDRGGWTVFQNRDALPIRENFTRTWDDYVEGFGDLKGEFWLGLENIHVLTNSEEMELRIDLVDWDGVKRWAKYGIFHVGDAESRYVLTIGNYSGDAGNAMTYPSNEAFNLSGMQFSTHDQDNDLYLRNCAEDYRGGWWFNACHRAHLNGYQIIGNDPKSEGINWLPFRGWRYSLKKAGMKIRPVFNGF